MRVWNLYESLAVRTPDFSELQMLLAESIEPGKTTATWTIRLKPGLTFHNGKPVTADDVIFSIQRITDPKDPKVGAASIGYIDRKSLKKMDDRTVRLQLQFANSAFPDDIGQYFNSIVPTDYDPKNPSAPARSSTTPSRPASRAASRSSPTTGRRASRTSTNSSSSTSPRTRRVSTRCSAARSTRSTTCRPPRSRASRATPASRC
jgi:ABC-type transport system substrate-binding protein